MTPYRFAQVDCGNCAADGSCLGISSDCLAPGKARVSACPLDRCVLAERPARRCGYFEKCVLPLADWPSPKDDPKLQQKRLKARESYWRAVREAIDPSFRVGRDGKRRMRRKPPKGKKPCLPSKRRASKCPDCGARKAKRRRYCEDCKRRRRLETFHNVRRRAKAASGGEGQSNSCRGNRQSQGVDKTRLTESSERGPVHWGAQSCDVRAEDVREGEDDGDGE